MKAHVKDVMREGQESRKQETSERISPWLIIAAILLTIAAAYEVYARGNYLGLHQVLSEQPIGHTLGWIPLTGLFLCPLIINPPGYVFTKKRYYQLKA